MRYRVAGRLKVKAGRMVRHAGTESRNRQGSKPGGQGEKKKKLLKSGQQEIHHWLTWTYKTN
jgi:hypothetical protein